MRDVGWREEGTEQRFGCLLCHFLLVEADPWDLPAPPSSPHVPPLQYQMGRMHTRAHTPTRSQMSHGAASVARREDSVRINHMCLSRGAISGDIMPGQPSGLEIVYVQYLRATNLSFGCCFGSHWQRWEDGLKIVLNRQGVVQE